MPLNTKILYNSLDQKTDLRISRKFSAKQYIIKQFYTCMSGDVSRLSVALIVLASSSIAFLPHRGLDIGCIPDGGFASVVFHSASHKP